MRIAYYEYAHANTAWVGFSIYVYLKKNTEMGGHCPCGGFCGVGDCEDVRFDCERENGGAGGEDS